MKLRLDRARVGHDGETYEVFDPRWWQVHRWVWWVVFVVWGKKPRAFLDVSSNDHTVEQRIRIWQPPVPPRRRIEDQFKPR